MTGIENDIGQANAEPTPVIKAGLGGWLVLFQIRLIWALYQGANDIIFSLNIIGIVMWLGLLVSAALFYKGFIAFRIVYTVVFGINVLITAIAWCIPASSIHTLIVGTLSIVIEAVIIVALFKSQRV